MKTEVSFTALIIGKPCRGVTRGRPISKLLPERDPNLSREALLRCEGSLFKFKQKMWHSYIPRGYKCFPLHFIGNSLQLLTQQSILLQC